MEPSPPLQTWRAPALQSNFRVREHSPGPEWKGVGGLSQNTWGCWVEGHLERSELEVLRVDFNLSMCQQWTVVLCQFACRLISL